MALVPTPLLRYNWLKRVIAKKSRVLEIGTGPTAMMVLLASRVFRCQCLATEINSDYLDLARKNVEKNDLEAQIHLLHSKGEILWGLIPPEMKFNHIISNPPYYPPGSYPEKSPWIGTPGEIQGRGDFGEKFILQLIEEGSDYLEKGGTLSFLVPENLKPLREKINNYLSENQVKYNVFGLKAGTRVRMVYTISQVDSSH